MDPSHLKYLMAAFVALNGALGTASMVLTNHDAKIACLIAVAAVNGFLGMISPGLVAKPVLTVVPTPEEVKQ